MSANVLALLPHQLLPYPAVPLSLISPPIPTSQRCLPLQPEYRMNGTRSILVPWAVQRSHFLVLEKVGRFLHTQGYGELNEGKDYNEIELIEFLTAWGSK